MGFQPPQPSSKPPRTYILERLMTERILPYLIHFVTQVIGSMGYAGIVALMGIESACVPLPSEIIMPFAGFLVGGGRFNLVSLALAGAIGSVIGSWATYALGYFSGRPLIIRYGRYVLISEHDLHLAEKFFQKFGSWSSFIGRVLPVVRTFISIPAGVGKVPFYSFTIYR